MSVPMYALSDGETFAVVFWKDHSGSNVKEGWREEEEIRHKEAAFLIPRESDDPGH